eukprot:gene5216-10438_t
MVNLHETFHMPRFNLSLRICNFIILFGFLLSHMSSSYRAVIRSRPNKHRLLEKNTISFESVNSVEDIKNDLQKYLESREIMQLPPLEEEKKGDSPLEMFRPTGWYKDEIAEDLKKRSDSKLPAVLHPLSYVELERHGFGYLIEGVMKLGGPHEVGKSIGILWQEPERIKADWNSPLAPKKEKFFNLDMRGSLLLGSAFEDRLAAAADLDMEELKKKVQDESNRYEQMENEFEGEDYSKQRKTKRINRFKDEEIPVGERFTLDNIQRAYLFAVCASSALAHGRASQDLITNHIWGDFGNTLITTSEIVSFALLSASLLSAIFSFTLSKSMSRNVVVWALKGFLGGPMSISMLSKLPPLTPKQEEKE